MHSSENKPFELESIDTTQQSFFDSSRSWTYSFPVFSSSSRPEAARKINHHLAQDLLDINPGQIEVSIFEKVWATKKNRIPWISDLSYEILRNDGNIVTISFSYEGCGAYCEWGTDYYSYDAQTGDYIDLDCLFNPSGLNWLTDTLWKIKSDSLDFMINAIAKEIKNTTREDVIGHMQDEMQLYEWCLDRGKAYLHPRGHYLTEDNLIVEINRCANHATRALDNIGSIQVPLDLQSLSPHLSAYGNEMAGN